MSVRRSAGAVLAAVAIAAAGLGAAGRAAAQDERQDAARELARLMMDSATRRAIDEQVRASMMQALTSTLQERLNRRLVDIEVNRLAEIVRGFITETLPPSRTEQIAADIYVRYFDDAELREMLRFQRSAVARKAAQLAPILASETTQAIDREIRTSAALPGTLTALRQMFPVLGLPESP